MRRIGAVAIPPKGTKARVHLEETLKNEETPEQKKILKKLFKNAQGILAGQQLNGAGHESDQTLRWFQNEYNNRVWGHDLHSLPSTFNVLEAFLQYRPDINTLILLEEKNHLFLFSDFLDWYTSGDTKLDLKIALEAFQPGVIYTFDNLDDPSNLLYGIESKGEIGISAVAMVRFDTEISVMCVAGETENLKEKSKQLKERFSKYESFPDRSDIKPDPTLVIEAVPLRSKLPLWRLLALTRFNLIEGTQSVRYICHDIGNAYDILSDDPVIFLDYKGQFKNKKAKETAHLLAEKVREYNSLFDLCSTTLFLPLYFEKFADNITAERFKTKYANESGKTSFLKTKKNIPQNLKIGYRNVNVLNPVNLYKSKMDIIYSVPNFHIQTSGYWRKLDPGKIGTDKNGKPAHGRTWISKKLSWIEAELPYTLVAKRTEKRTPSPGPDPGFIYVMRSPLHPRNVFKIGLTKRTTKQRADEISSATGVPGRIYVMHEWAVGDCVSTEKEIHKRLDEYRVDSRREFFEAPLKYIVSVIDEVIRFINKSS